MSCHRVNVRGPGVALFVFALSGGCVGNGQDPATFSPDDFSTSAEALSESEVLPTGPVCTPTGAHAQHARYSCDTCHACGGVLQFSPTGAAVAPGRPLPSFNATTKVCSNVACHGMYSGVFNYVVIAGDGGDEAKSFAYAGNGGTTPPWNSTGVGCGACHGNPPVAVGWHGTHANRSFATANNCLLCHPDAIGNGVGTAINTANNCGPNRNLSCASFHANGVVDLTPIFYSWPCLDCH